MNLVALPAFSDNYLWVIHDGEHALVVDPGDALPVQAFLVTHGLTLELILVTHHHPDHVGGLAALQGAWPKARTLRPADPRIDAAGEAASNGMRWLWRGAELEVLAVPGHTLSHLAYLLRPPEPTAAMLFCGDTLFSGGCGRLFEGTPAQMAQSLDTLAALPADTRVCCAHEYTLSNLRFAQVVEPDNLQLAAHLQHCEGLRLQGKATLPSSIGLERAINPFLRCQSPQVVQSALTRGAHGADPVAVFATLREWKNKF